MISLIGDSGQWFAIIRRFRHSVAPRREVSCGRSSMSPTILLIIYCVLILLASLAGGWIPMLIRLTHKRMEMAVSFVAGVMLGVGVLHMLPHAFHLRAAQLGATSPESAWGDESTARLLTNPIMLWLLAGFLAMFFIERFFCFHHHDVPGEQESPDEHGHDHGPGCSHHHEGEHQHRHALTWTGTAIGLTLHSLIEGVALAASVEAARHMSDGHHGHVEALAGLGTFLVILLHKPFDSLTLGTIMTLGKKSTRSKHLVNGAFSLMIVAGVALFHLGLLAEGDRSGMVSAALAFSAGTFLCISMSDLLPELQFHQHDRGKLSAALLLGLAVAWGVGVLEAHMH
jgi:zinc and cadmium transporter